MREITTSPPAYSPFTDQPENSATDLSPTALLVKIARVRVKQHLGGYHWRDMSTEADISTDERLATLADLCSKCAQQDGTLTSDDTKQLRQYIRLQPHKSYSKQAAAFSWPAAMLFGAIPAAAYANALVKLFGTGPIALPSNIVTSPVVFFASGIVEEAVFRKNIKEFFLIRAGIVQSDTLEEYLAVDASIEQLQAKAATIWEELQHEFSIVKFVHTNPCRYATLGAVSAAAGIGGTIFAYNEIVKIFNFHMLNYLSQYNLPKALAIGALLNIPSATTATAGTLFRYRQSIEIGMNEDAITVANIKKYPLQASLSLAVGVGACIGLIKTAYESLDEDAGTWLNSTGFGLMTVYSLMESTLFASKMFNIIIRENWHKQLNKLFSGYGFMLGLHLLAGIMPFIEGYLEDEDQYLSMTVLLMVISGICEPVGEFFKDYPAIVEQDDVSLSAGCHEFCMPGHSHEGHGHHHGDEDDHENPHGHSHTAIHHQAHSHEGHGHHQSHSHHHRHGHGPSREHHLHGENRCTIFSTPITAGVEEGHTKTPEHNTHSLTMLR